MTDYPDHIDFENQFSVKSIDLDTFTYPKLRVRTWSDLFGVGGSYAVEPVEGEAEFRGLTRVNVKHNDPSIRAHLESLVEAWNEDPKAEWLHIMRAAAKRNSAYYDKRVTEFDKIVAEAEEGRTLLLRVTEEEERYNS